MNSCRRGEASRAPAALAAARTLAKPREPAPSVAHVALLIQAVENELRRLGEVRDAEGLKERIVARFERIEAGVGRRMMRATGILATIGATAPSSACSAQSGAS